MSRSVRIQQCVTTTFNEAEYRWFEEYRRAFGVSKALLLRRGVQALARETATACPLRDKLQKSYDRSKEQPRAWSDRNVLFDRRVSGETARSLAHEYGIDVGYLYMLFTEVQRDRGVRLQQVINEDVKERAERVLADPFTNLGFRTREIAEALIASRTYQEAADATGVSRQRVHQVAAVMRRESGVPDGRRKIGSRP